MTKISLEMGSGGRLMRDFISEKVVPLFKNPILSELHDAAHLPGGLALTTDSYTVDPLFSRVGILAVSVSTGRSMIWSFPEPGQPTLLCP